MSEWFKAIGQKGYVHFSGNPPLLMDLYPREQPTGLAALDVPAALRKEQETQWQAARIGERLAALQADIKRMQEAIASLTAELASRPVVSSALLHDLGDAAYKLVAPIQVSIETYEDEVLATFPEIEAFGSGDTAAEAIIGLKNEVVSLFEELFESDWEELGRVPQGWRRVLESLIVRTYGAA